MDEVVLYFPNYSWRSKIGDLVSSNDKKFSWFLCSKKYRYGKNLDSSIAEISKHATFYDETNGRTLAVASKPKILILNNFDGDYDKMMKNVKKMKLQGFSYITKSSDPCDEDLICCGVKFVFAKGNLVVSFKQNFCPIIIYSKRNYKKIKLVLEEFPTPDEMDDIMKKFPCSTISKVLYDMISEYLLKTKNLHI
jgi:hypothetical protein